jgi:tRNA threonylcarbamoyladenosine biosynthesis protein TsaB
MEKPSATLWIETSTPHGSLGLCSATGEWQEESFFSDRGHNCELFPPLQRLVQVREPGEISRIIVGTGPGSYSGTRVGIAVAQGLAVVHQCQIVGIPSLLGLPTVRSMCRCLAIGDARRGDWWWSWMEEGKMLAAPTMGNLEELLEQTKQAEAVLSLDKIQHPALVERVRQEIPIAQNLWHAWEAFSAAEREKYTAELLQPLYLKPPHITAAKPVHPLLRSAKGDLPTITPA